MLRTSGILAGLLVLASSANAGTPGERPPTPAQLREAKPYALSVFELCAIISRDYVREVSTNSLCEAAIVGLYETAREPLPGGLLLDLKKAVDIEEQYGLLLLARAQLGDRPELADNLDLIASIQALPTALDPYCGLVSAHEFQSRGESTINFGFDLEGDAPQNKVLRVDFGREFVPPALSVPSIPFRVRAVRPGGPAQVAGLRPGDVLTHIDGRAITAENAAKIYDAVFLGTIEVVNPREHLFTIQRADKPFPIQMKLRKLAYVPESVFGVKRVNGNDWHYWLDEDRKIAYVRIGGIETNTPTQLANALTDTRAMNGLILDLRWCPGGYLNQSAEIAGMFVDEGRVASVKYRRPERRGTTEFRAEDVGLIRFRAKKVPLLVLVNSETMGGGELIAAALQDNLRATIAGQRTVGKASIQSPVMLSTLPGNVFKLTGGTFLRPNGKNLQRFPDSTAQDDWGVRPDPGREITVSPSLGKQLKEWNLTYALRPGIDREALPLDDPDADPQRRMALKMMRKMLAEVAKPER